MFRQLDLATRAEIASHALASAASEDCTNVAEAIATAARTLGDLELLKLASAITAIPVTTWLDAITGSDVSDAGTAELIGPLMQRSEPDELLSWIAGRQENPSISDVLAKAIARRLMDSLSTNATPRNREAVASAAKLRSAGG